MFRSHVLLALTLALPSTALAEASFSVSVNKVEAKKGQAAAATVLIKPGSGWHMNKDFPTNLKLTVPTGVTADKTEFKKGDAKLTETEASFQVSLQSAKPGTYQVPGTLSFAVCTDKECVPKKTPITIELAVK